MFEYYTFIPVAHFRHKLYDTIRTTEAGGLKPPVTNRHK